MDLTLSLIWRVSKNCSVVLGLGLEWTQTGWETIWGHWNKVECPLGSVVKGLGSGWAQTAWETVWGHRNEVECPLTVTENLSAVHLCLNEQQVTSQPVMNVLADTIQTYFILK